MCAGSKEIIISAKDQLAMTYKIGVSQIVTSNEGWPFN